MESAADYAAHNSKACVFPGSSSYHDADVVELSSAPAWAATQQKRKRTQIVSHEIIEIDEDDDLDAVMIIGEGNLNHKNKQPVGYDMDWQKQVQSTLTCDIPGSSTFNGFPDNYLPDIPKSSQPDSGQLNFSDGYWDAIDNFSGDAIDNFAEFTGFAYNFGLNAKFDGWDMPPMPPWVEEAAPWSHKPPPRMPSKNEKMVITDEIDIKFKSFKQFDTVQSHSDHHFHAPPERSRGSHHVNKTSKNWAKKIQDDWKVLEKDLPDTIFVRVYEDRMDLLRAVIIGPAGTPYHDGLFFFDVYFPPNYPQSPPHVYYHSGGLRLNPNLYACGKVCLSLLNTWTGNGCERWNPSKSTMLQVLVSIQALVLNAKPFFNEPGYEGLANTPAGESQSMAYNEQTFLLSCKTMLYSIRRPPKHFDDFVTGHFRSRGHAIIVACRAYMDGAQVGCLVGEGVQDVDEGDKSCSSTFRSSLKHLYEDLLKEFTDMGAHGLGGSGEKLKTGESRVLDTTLKL